MIHCPWVDALHSDGRITPPYNIDFDFQYLPSLKEKFYIFIEHLEKNNAPEYLIGVAKEYANQIISAIDSYYQGNIIEAHSIVKDLIDDCCKDSKFAVSDVNNSIAFPNIVEGCKEVQFFRARLNENVVDFPAQQMLHIPFKNRSIVKSERFSIPGLPCLYLGNSSYVCWIEMGCPADFKFNVSPVVLDNTQQIFNLTVSIQNFYDIVDLELTDETKQKRLIEILKLYLLNMTTSFNVKEEHRNFKSEYIIAQMIMLACKSNGLNGITYFSKRVANEIFAHIIGVNLVLFADYNGEDYQSNICNHVEIGDSFNYSMFKQLCDSLKYKSYPLRIDMSPFINNIGTFKRQFPYNETEFYLFDKYLFANWNRIVANEN